MPQSKKKADNEIADTESAGTLLKQRWQIFAMIGAGIAVILLTIGIIYYQFNIAPFRRVIITVDDSEVRMGYFLKRTELAGANTMDMLEILAGEQIVKSEAPHYGINVTEEEVDQELRRIAESENDNVTDSEFQEWYRQQLSKTGLSNNEYRDLIGTRLLAARLNEYWAQKVPTVAEQVHLYAILVRKYEEAQKVKEKVEAGEDFASLAQEVSLHEESRQRGGELGWFPWGVMNPSIDYVIFNLDIDEISEPLPAEDGYYLFLVAEKAAAREIDEESVKALQSKALENWLLGEMQYHDIEYNFDPEISAWINWQLSKMARD